MGWLIRHAEGARVALKVTPRASSSVVQGMEIGGCGRQHLAVRVNAPPVGGKANAALIKLLARRWRIPQRVLEVVSGASGRRKVLHIHGSPDELTARLRAIEGDRNDHLSGP